MRIDENGDYTLFVLAKAEVTRLEQARRTASLSRWQAILHRRCPRCLEGDIYERWLKPHESCSVCGLKFEREPGYFLGSFYISYALGGIVGAPTVLLVIYGDLSFLWLFPLVVGWVGLFVPFIVSYARTLWYHLDQLADPR